MFLFRRLSSLEHVKYPHEEAKRSKRGSRRCDELGPEVTIQIIGPIDDGLVSEADDAALDGMRRHTPAPNVESGQRRGLVIRDDVFNRLLRRIGKDVFRTRRRGPKSARKGRGRLGRGGG